METNHRFKIGQSVNLTHRRLQSAPPGEYRIVRQLPVEGGNFQYRIKSALENHERVVSEDQIFLSDR